MNILIIGASHGIGLEFVRQYAHAGARVIATARGDEGMGKITALGAKALRVDVAQPASVSGLAWQLDGEKLDIVVINAGVYGPSTSGMQPPSADDFDAVMHTNVLGPMRVLPQLTDAFALNAKLAIISSRMGSIGLRESTIGWLYRASKAAVNSVLKDASITLAGQATCIAFHPGWVRTDMGGSGADLAVEESVSGMRQVLAGLQAKDNGNFFNYDGKALAW
jgi:NAD(P)-dependent dehydrogenase (short-subunit alcohol dehydrogenase family)